MPVLPAHHHLTSSVQTNEVKSCPRSMPIVSSSMDRLLCSPLIPLRREAADYTTQFRLREAETRPLARRLSCRPKPLDRRLIPELTPNP